MEIKPKEMRKLAKMMNHIVMARSPSANNEMHEFLYYIPKNGDYAKSALRIFTKYQLPAELHISSLNNRAFPVVRFPMPANARKEMSGLLNLAKELRIIKEAQDAEKADKFMRARTQMNWGQRLVYNIQQIFER